MLFVVARGVFGAILVVVGVVFGVLGLFGFVLGFSTFIFGVIGFFESRDIVLLGGVEIGAESRDIVRRSLPSGCGLGLIVSSRLVCRDLDLGVVLL